MSTTINETPRVWVGCLGCYNAGALVGEWIDAEDAEDVTVRGLHDANPQALTADPYASAHEELWCMDHEGFGGLLAGECSPAEAQRIAEAIAGLDSWTPVAAVAAWIANGNGELLDDLSGFDDDYAGEWSSEVEYAQDFAEQVGAIDDDARWPATCIDWERAARELFMDYWSAEAPDGGIYVFRS